VELTTDLTLTELAQELDCSLPLLTSYLATYKEWQDPDLCDCGERECTCGKYFATITHSRTALMAGTHVPDPFMDPGSPLFADRMDQYESPFPAVTLEHRVLVLPYRGSEITCELLDRRPREQRGQRVL
jgi:hypothetical protein